MIAPANIPARFETVDADVPVSDEAIELVAAMLLDVAERGELEERGENKGGDQ